MYLCQVGKRNIRILRHELSSRISEIKDLEVQVILLNGKTWFGKVVRIDSQSITVQDANAQWTNVRRHSHLIQLPDIMEVIFDLVSDY